MDEDNPGDARTPQNPAERASVLMKRGIALLNENSAESLPGALLCFDQALAIRRALPANGESWAGYVLAASWMNRADVLTRLGGAENLAEAVRSYDEALAVLRGIPLDENPLYRRRFAIAWLNRGITLQEQGTPASLAEARISFEQAIEGLRGLPGEPVLAACAWMNRGNVLLRLHPPEGAGARASATTAIAALGGVEEQDLVAAETGLKARHILCQALAEALVESASGTMELVSEATEAVASGLALARLWEAKGETRFAPLQGGLFRFGAILHQQHLPGALAQFVRENVGQSPENIELHTAAVEALRQAWTEFQSDGFSAVNTPRFERWLDTLRGLRLVETRLRELRSAKP